MKKANIDSPFYRTMGRIGDLVLANVLWLVCCLPILTAGASTLGLFTVVNKMAAKEDYTVRTDFFKAFKRDFKQSTALWLGVLLAGAAAPARRDAHRVHVGQLRQRQCDAIVRKRQVNAGQSRILRAQVDLCPVAGYLERLERCPIRDGGSERLVLRPRE